MGPFAQQLISYPTRPVLSDDAMYSRAQLYDSQYDTNRSASQWGTTYRTVFLTYPCTLSRTNFCQESDMGSRMQGAILSGLFNMSLTETVSCPTGDCRWDEFTTLAIKSDCYNVTASTKVDCHDGIIDLTCYYTGNDQVVQELSVRACSTFTRGQHYCYPSS